MARTRKPGIPAALHPEVMAQLGPGHDLRLQLVLNDPGVQEALELVREIHSNSVVPAREAMRAAQRGPELIEAARALARAQEVCAQAFEEFVFTAARRAEKLRSLILVAEPVHARLRRLCRELSTTGDQCAALDRILRRHPAATDLLYWKVRALGSNWLWAALRDETQRIERERHKGDGTVARPNGTIRVRSSAGDVEVYEFVQARPRRRCPASIWWQSLLTEWNQVNSGQSLRGLHAFQHAYRRGRAAAAAALFAEAHSLEALETRESDRRERWEELQELVARARSLTPTQRATLERELQDPGSSTRSQRQDLVQRLRRAANC